MGFLYTYEMIDKMIACLTKIVIYILIILKLNIGWMFSGCSHETETKVGSLWSLIQSLKANKFDIRDGILQSSLKH